MLKTLISRFRFALLAVLLVLAVQTGAYAQAGASNDDTEAAPDIMEGMSFDSTFLAEYSEQLGLALTNTCNPRLIMTVAEWLGTPYRHAGYSKAGIDCSGFVAKIYEEVYGLTLTHSSSAMIFQMKQMVPKDQLREGDILFFRIHGKRISHVGMYLGDGKFIHASSSRGIVVEELECPYYHRAYYAAGRPYDLVE